MRTARRLALASAAAFLLLVVAMAGTGCGSATIDSACNKCPMGAAACTKVLTDTQTIALGGRQFAVQPMWSNEAFDATGNGCVVSR